VFVDEFEERPTDNVTEEDVNKQNAWDALQDDDHALSAVMNQYMDTSGALYNVLAAAMTKEDMKLVRSHRSQYGKPQEQNGFGLWRFFVSEHAKRSTHTKREYREDMDELDYNLDTYFRDFQMEFGEIADNMKAAGCGDSESDLVDILLIKVQKLSQFDGLGSAITILGVSPTLIQMFEAIERYVRAHPQLRIAKDDKPRLKNYGNDQRGYVAKDDQQQNRGNNNNQNQNGNSREKCFNCDQIGHRERDCSQHCKVHKKLKGVEVFGHTRFDCRLRQTDEWIKHRKETENKFSGKRNEKHQEDNETETGRDAQVAKLLASVNLLVQELRGDNGGTPLEFEADPKD
jgi:hypothetical protein